MTLSKLLQKGAEWWSWWCGSEGCFWARNPDMVRSTSVLEHPPHSEAQRFSTSASSHPNISKYQFKVVRKSLWISIYLSGAKLFQKKGPWISTKLKMTIVCLEGTLIYQIIKYFWSTTKELKFSFASIYHPVICAIYHMIQKNIVQKEEKEILYRL